MFKELTNLTHNEVVVKEATAMRNDLSVATEVILRERMCSAILIEYAATLLKEGKSYDSIRTAITSEVNKMCENPYLPKTFIVKVMSDLNAFFMEKESRKEKIKTRFFAHKESQKAFKKFADPALFQEAEKVASGLEKFAVSDISSATAELYMTEAVEFMQKHSTIPYDFFTK